MMNRYNGVNDFLGEWAKFLIVLVGMNMLWLCGFTQQNPVGLISGITPACSFSSISFSGIAPPGDTYFWQTDNTGTDQTYNASVSLSVTVSGNYFVRARSNSTGLWSSTSVGPYPVVINTVPGIATGLSGTAVGSSNFTATWNVVPGATGYYVDVYAPTVAPDLIISEYVEGSSNNKYIEIFNGTGVAKDLADYRLRLYTNGNSFSSSDVQLSGILLNNSTIVYKNASAIIYPGVSFSNTAVNFNGNDAVALYKISIGSTIDIFGRIGDNPGTAWSSGGNTTTDKTLVRNSNVISGISSSPTGTGPGAFTTLGSEWTQFNIDAVSNLGTHIMNGGISYVPGFQDIFCTENFIELTGLNPGTTYYYVVRSVGSGCISTNSMAGTVSTELPCAAASTIISFYPMNGPAGTQVNIKGTGFSGTTAVQFGHVPAISFTIQSDTNIIAEVPVNAPTDKIYISESGCAAISPAYFTMLVSNGNCSNPLATATNLFISEVYDAENGSLGYIEIFNGTATTINLNPYELRLITGSNSINDFALSGLISPGSTYVIRIGTNAAPCTAVSLGLDLPSAPGFNGNDQLYLRQGGANIDYVPNPNFGGGTQAGFSQVRRPTSTGPSVAYNDTDWTISATENCSHLGVAPYNPAVSGIKISQQPADIDCNPALTFNVNANTFPNGIPTYVWHYNDPSSMTGWGLVSDLTSIYSGLSTTPAGMNTITIAGSTAILLNFQFYVEVKYSSSPQCVVSSNAAQYKYNSFPLYRSANNGNWSTITNWQMYDTGSSAWISACNYPTAINSRSVTIKEDHKISLDTDNTIQHLLIESGGTFMTTSSTKLTMFNGTSGADLVVEGTFIDSANSNNSLNFATGAAWQLGNAGSLIRCNSSSAAVYRDNYQGGMINIPASANWKIRYYGNNVSFTTATGGAGSGSFPSPSYYPNLSIESYSGTWDPPGTVISSRFSGSASTATIYGSLDIGGLGTGAVIVYNENRHPSPIQVNGDLIVRAGNTLTNVGNADGTGFDLDGNLIVDGKLLLNSMDTGLLRLSGSNMQSISGSGSIALYDFEMNNTSAASPNIVHSMPDTVYNRLLISGLTKLQMNSGNLTLRSGLDKTARIEAIPATASISYVNGKFVVERYINTGIGHQRSWQFLATPTMGQTIYQSWQEGGNNSIVGFGTQVTGPVVANGIDAYTSAPSLKTFNSITGNWDGISNSSGTEVNNAKGYMLFVRGDRSSIISPGYQPPAVPTILRTAGSIHQPSAAPPLVTIPANHFGTVGNPYASPISLDYLFSNSSVFNNLALSVVVWDPSLYGSFGVGGFQTISAALGNMPVPGGTALYPAGQAFNDIQSGQAFFVQALNAPGSIQFNENMKSNSDLLVNIAAGNSDSKTEANNFVNSNRNRSNKQILKTSLYTSGAVMADGNAVVFDQRYADSIDAYDAFKLYNAGENLGILRNGRWLAVEARSKLQEADTIFYAMYNLGFQDYRFHFVPENIAHLNMKAFLIDNYMGSRTPVSLEGSSFINFNVNEMPGSSKADRFYLVFLPKKDLAPKPLSAKDGGGLATLQKTKEVIRKEFSVYPNPVIGKEIKLHLSGFAAGKYLLTLNNQQGQPVYNCQVMLYGDSEHKVIYLPSTIKPGTYNLTLAGQSTNKSVPLVIQ